VVAGVVSATSLALYTGLTIYFVTYFWQLPSSSILLLVLMGLISAPIAAAVAPPLSRLWGKRRACMTLFFASVVTTNGPITLRLLDLFPENGSPILLPILLANAVLGGVFGTGGFILVTSMIADIVEESQVKTGRRSEGLLFSADSLLNKIVSGFATVLPGLLLAFVGFPTGVSPAALDPEIMRRLAMIFVPITVTLSLFSIATWRFYRIDASAHEANLAALQDATPADQVAELAAAHAPTTPGAGAPLPVGGST